MDPFLREREFTVIQTNVYYSSVATPYFFYTFCFMDLVDWYRSVASVTRSSRNVVPEYGNYQILRSSARWSGFFATRNCSTSLRTIQIDRNRRAT